ncbi:MAG TPA: type II/IV secretion system protein [Desulfobacteraceae bacterium]|nr:Flp pilus assembly complex ATPase component TadA [Deltaproteobacteria bacterium]RLB98236.1 MAG: type II/IV secretion system protein [Deltaproteobacteria bacterium]HDI60760.1 type II/IV secretion system protein [Desulfobacteraceae bacterium]
MRNDLNTRPFDPKLVCQILIRAGLLSKSQAKEVLEKQERIRTRLAEQQRRHETDDERVPVTIVDVIASMNLMRGDGGKGLVDEDSIFQALAAAWKMPYRKLDPLKLNLNTVTSHVPKHFAKKHLVLPVSVDEGVLTVAAPMPLNFEVLDDITRVSNLKVEQIISAKSDIIKLIDEFFGFKRSIAAAENLFGGGVDLGNLEQYVKLTSGDELPATDQHIVNAVNHLLVYAFDQRASDVHIEPKREQVFVRLRIDGILHTVYKLPKKVHNAIVSRIKTLSRLNMAEKRRPQDGRIKIDRGGREVEIRVSTVPVAFGEKVVMRIMDPDVLFQDLDGLGFTADDQERYQQFIQMPHGIVLVTGPTGSGKSTTLYSTLRHIATPEKNVVTVEDPIEMIHEDFNQIGVQPAVDVTFSTILRNILRQDPDIIMIGEMRDLETAQNAVQAALTGHLVLSTLHTNDAPSAIIRLLDLGVPPYLIQATLVGILAQRLVRRICLYCKEPFTMEASHLKDLGLDPGRDGAVTLHRGTGCNRCRQTGYYGRLGIYEVMPFTEGIRRLTTADADAERIRHRALAEGMATLRQSGIRRMLEGKTTYQEVLRATWGYL